MLNLYDILKSVLNESVSSNNVVDAINNKYQVIINYSDEKNRAPRKRIVEPYAYGISKAGNEVFRAYQYNGDTYRGVPKWKLFRLDRVKSWQPTDRHFNMPPDRNGWNAEAYNEMGDETMSVVLNQVSFDNNGEELYSPNDSLNINRNRTSNLRNSKPINISQMKDNSNAKGIANNTTDSVINTKKDDEFQKMLQRNLDITRKEKEKRGFSLSSNNDDGKPIVNNSVKDVVNDDDTTEPINNNTVNSTLDNNNDNEFQKMLQRNLDITRKEKEKRGFSLNNKKF